MSWKARVPVLAAALWWGSLTAIGFIAVPLLFVHLPTSALAGQTASKLFTAQAWLSLGCGVLILLASRSPGEPARMNWGQGALIFVLAGLLLALLLEFAITPRILARQNLRLWHNIGTAAYVLQWMCALVVLWKTAFKRATQPGGTLSSAAPS
jgi:hypothetical protein